MDRTAWLVTLTDPGFTAADVERLVADLLAQHVPTPTVYGPLGLVCVDLTGDDVEWLRRRQDVTMRPEGIVSENEPI